MYLDATRGHVSVIFKAHARTLVTTQSSLRDRFVCDANGNSEYTARGKIIRD